MSKQEIIDFFSTHKICPDERQKAIDSCDSMHKVWLNAQPELLIYIATCVLPDKEARLFSCWCVMQIWHLLTDDIFKIAVIVAEKYASGEVTPDELDAARVAADLLAGDEATWADNAARWTTDEIVVAIDVATASAYAAGAPVPVDAGWAYDTTVDDAREAQAAYLREMFNPFLKDETK